MTTIVIAHQCSVRRFLQSSAFQTINTNTHYECNTICDQAAIKIQTAKFSKYLRSVRGNNRDLVFLVIRR